MTTIHDLAHSKGVTPLVREALLRMETELTVLQQVIKQRVIELTATEGRVEILSNALIESRHSNADLVSELVSELRHIADADTRDWVYPNDFKVWAQRRARDAITRTTGEEA